MKILWRTTSHLFCEDSLRSLSIPWYIVVSIQIVFRNVWHSTPGSQAEESAMTRMKRILPVRSSSWGETFTSTDWSRPSLTFIPEPLSHYNWQGRRSRPVSKILSYHPPTTTTTLTLLCCFSASLHPPVPSPTPLSSQLFLTLKRTTQEKEEEEERIEDTRTVNSKHPSIHRIMKEGYLSYVGHWNNYYYCYL